MILRVFLSACLLSGSALSGLEFSDILQGPALFRLAGWNNQFLPFHLPFINNGNIFNRSNGAESSIPRYVKQSDDPVPTTAMPTTTAESPLPNVDWSNFMAPTKGDIDETCRNDSLAYINALNTISTLATGNGWAYKMFDASAKLPPSSVLQGNLKLLGAFDSCLEVVAPKFNGKHCLVSFTDPNFMAGREADAHHEELFKRYTLKSPKRLDLKNAELFNTLLPMVSFGRCIPDTCSSKDLETSLQVFLNELNMKDLHPHVLNCHTAEEEIPFTTADWVMISVVLLFSMLLCIGTFIDLTIKYLNAEFYSDRVVQIFLGFSLYTNTVKLFSTGNMRPDSLTSINGIRFLSMTWVLFSHAYSEFTGGLPVNNLFAMFDPEGPINGRPAFQAILNGYPSVDSFFFIGATLLSYITLKELDKHKSSAKFWLMFYVHRYIRLTGVFAIIMGLWATLLRHLATGPQSSRLVLEADSCQESWWVNMLYINNIMPQWNLEKPWCLGQSWYLANDMQFFIISPIFLYFLWRMPMFGLILSFIGLIAGTVAPMVVVYTKDLQLSPSFMSSGWTYMIDFYIVPWCRFQPYIMGLIFGYFLHKMRGQPKLKLNPYFLIWIWAIIGAIGCVTIYGLYPYTEEFILTQSMVGSMAARVAYNGLHRIAWSLCVGWVILACTKGAGGPVNSILSWPAWIPLARLSYCIYLVHMTVISYFVSIITYSVTFSHSLALYWILAMLCFSIFVAYIMSMLFEIPLAHLENLLFAYLGVGKFPAVKKQQAPTVIENGKH